MKKLLVLIFCAITVAATAQQGTVKGRVADARSGENIEYATVALLRPGDSTLVNGTVSESNGSFNFKVPYGTYLLRVTFIGYQTYIHPSRVTLSADKPTANIGKIQIKSAATTMEAVEVSAERSMVEYQLDKRVINVDKNIVSSGGTATDVLEQVPSVAVDNDGNVTLRGSTNVKVLINGRPSELLSSDLQSLLEQIPATTVENVEVITNPSAKYDPEGMSGIINIKLKDRAAGALGLNGVANLNVGAPLPFLIPDELPKFIPTAMGNISLNYTTDKFNITFNADGGLRQRANRSVSDVTRKNSVLPSHDSLREYGVTPFRMGSAKVGFEYYIDTTSSILVGYQFRYGEHERRSRVYSTDLMFDNLYDYRQIDTNYANHSHHVVNLGYVKRFARPEQQLTADISYSRRFSDGDGWQEQTYDNPLANHERYYLRTAERRNNGNVINIKADYTHPFSKSLRLETGYEGRLQFSDQDYKYYMTTDSTPRALDNSSSMHYNYNQQVHAVYATAGWTITEKLSAQAGLRGEYALVDGTDQMHEGYSVHKAYPAFYPTLHASYQITKDQSVQLSYSRRVRRPGMRDLNPYLDVRQGMEMGFGNPDLDPEFTNAFELSYNIGFKRTNLFTSAYFRQTNNMLTRYGFVWDSSSRDHYARWMAYNPEYDGYWASTWQNLYQGINLGIEFIVDQQITDWWKVNLSINAYNSYIEGDTLLSNISNSTFRVDSKLNSYMTLPHDWTVQFSGQYRSPFNDLQTTMHASYWFDLAVKKDVLQRQGTVSLRVSDIFCTGGWGHSTHTDQLDREFRARRISPVVTLGFSYKINNGLKASRRQNYDIEDSGGNNDDY